MNKQAEVSASTSKMMMPLWVPQEGVACRPSTVPMLKFQARTAETME